MPSECTSYFAAAGNDATWMDSASTPSVQYLPFGVRQMAQKAFTFASMRRPGFLLVHIAVPNTSEPVRSLSATFFWVRL
jgi:hypothetical protein